jgi:hypothetical protein
MEERSRPHRMTQLVLGSDEPVEEATPPTPLPAGDDPIAVPPPAPAEPLPPADLELRRRQLAWFAERARFERSRGAADEVADGGR